MIRRYFAIRSKLLSKNLRCRMAALSQETNSFLPTATNVLHFLIQSWLHSSEIVAMLVMKLNYVYTEMPPDPKRPYHLRRYCSLVNPIAYFCRKVSQTPRWQQCHTQICHPFSAPLVMLITIAVAVEAKCKNDSDKKQKKWYTEINNTTASNTPSVPKTCK